MTYSRVKRAWHVLGAPCHGRRGHAVKWEISRLILARLSLYSPMYFGIGNTAYLDNHRVPRLAIPKAVYQAIEVLCISFLSPPRQLAFQFPLPNVSDCITTSLLG